MCCFNKVNLSAILLVHKRIINKECTVKNNNKKKIAENVIQYPLCSETFSSRDARHRQKRRCFSTELLTTTIKNTI